MTTTKIAFLQQLRKEKGKTQEEMAKIVKVSRQTYAKIENGEAELSLGWAIRIADFFDIKIDALLGEGRENPAFNLAKYVQILTNFIVLASSDGKIPKTKLTKLCYFLDFAWYYEHLESLTGQKYIKLPYGPVWERFLDTIDLLENEKKIQIDYTGESKLISTTLPCQRDLLNEEEFSLLQSIAEKRKLQNTKAIVDFTHQQLPRSMTEGLMEEVPYEFITQEEPENVY